MNHSNLLKYTYNLYNSLYYYPLINHILQHLSTIHRHQQFIQRINPNPQNHQPNKTHHLNCIHQALHLLIISTNKTILFNHKDYQVYNTLCNKHQHIHD